MTYVYILGNSDRTHLHCGMATDIVKAMQLYKSLPSTLIDKSVLNNLFYFEGWDTEENAQLRFKEIFSLTNEVKMKLVETINPNWVELVIGVNVDL